MTDNNLLDN